jgi:hypothetical protein
MARQGGRVQLELSDMRLVLNIAKMAKEGFSHAAIEERKYLMMNPHAEVREKTKRGVEFPGHKKVKAAIQREPAMLCQNQTSGCLPFQYDTAKYLRIFWRRNGTGAPPPIRRREPTPEPSPPLPGTPPATTGNTCKVQPSEIVNLPAGYSYFHRALPSGEFFGDDEDAEHDTNFDPDMLTDKG